MDSMLETGQRPVLFLLTAIMKGEGTKMEGEEEREDEAREAS